MLLARRIDIASEHQTAAVRKRRKEIRIGIDQLEAVVGETQLGHQRRRRLRRVRQRGNPESRMQLFGDRSAADGRTRLEHERLYAAARQNRGAVRPL